MFFLLVMIYILFQQKPVQGNVLKKMTTSPQFIAGNITLFSTQKRNENLTYNYQYVNTFSITPRITYTLAQNKPQDKIGLQAFGFILQNITNLQFTLLAIIGDKTKIMKMRVAFMIVDPSFSGSLHIHNNFPLDFWPNGNNPNPYTNTKQEYNNTINITEQYPNSNYKYFTQPLNNNKIFLFMNFLELSYADFNKHVIVIPQVQILTNYTYQVSINQGNDKGINQLIFTQLIINIDDFNNSANYTLQIYEIQNANTVPLQLALISDITVGLVALEASIGTRSAIYEWQAVNETTQYQIKVCQSTFLNLSGLTYMKTIMVIFKTFGCPPPYYYYNYTTNLCQEQCGQFFYNIVQNYTCGPCLYQCQSCSNNNTCITCNQSHNRALNSNRCSCIKGYYDDYINPQCGICSKVLRYCANCTYYNPIHNGFQYECFQCNTNTYTLLYKNHCICIKGYYDDSVGSQCQPCSAILPYCVSCAYYNPQKNGIQYECFECQNNTNRQIKQGSCACIKGYYDDQVNPKCLPCSEVLPYCLNCVYHNPQKDGIQYECFECDQERPVQNNVCGQSLSYLNINDRFDELPQSVKSAAKTVDAINSAPMVRVLLKFMGPLFFCIDDYWFYLYHQVNYANFTGISSFLITIIKIDSDKMVPLFFRTQILDKIDDIVNFTIFFTSNNSNYTTKEYRAVNQADMYLSRSFKQMILWNYSTTILFTLVLYLFYRLLCWLKVKRAFFLALKQYLGANTTIYALTQGLIESNLIFVIFQCSANLRIFFAGNFNDKLNNLVLVFYFFVGISFSICFYILFYNKFKKKIPDLQLSSIVYGSLFNLINFTIVGFLHGFFMKNPKFQAMALAMCKLLFCLITLLFWKVFDQFSLFLLTFLYYLAGIFIDILIYSKMGIINKDQTYSLQMGLIIIIIFSVILKLILQTGFIIYALFCYSAKAKINPQINTKKQKINKQNQCKVQNITSNASVDSNFIIKFQSHHFDSLNNNTQNKSQYLQNKNQSPEESSPVQSTREDNRKRIRLKKLKRRKKQSRFLQLRPNGL